MFTYRALITGVYDADTVTVTIDLGFKSYLRDVKLRLYGINAPEMRGAEKIAGRISRDWLRERILDEHVVIKTHYDKTGKYGRWLADIYPLDDHSKSFNTMLVEENWR